VRRSRSFRPLALTLSCESRAAIAGEAAPAMSRRVGYK
jgi:hypothetical protein